MSNTIIVKVKDMQPTNFKCDGISITLREGENNLKVEYWLEIKEKLKKQISSGFVSVNKIEESRVIESFQNLNNLAFLQLRFHLKKGNYLQVLSILLPKNG